MSLALILQGSRPASTIRMLRGKTYDYANLTVFTYPAGLAAMDANAWDAARAPPCMLAENNIRPDDACDLQDDFNCERYVCRLTPTATSLAVITHTCRA